VAPRSRASRSRLSGPRRRSSSDANRRGASVANWSNALKAATLPPKRLFHDLRRSAVRNLIQAGVDPSAAMKVSGHKTPKMLARYNIVTDDQAAAALLKQDTFLEGRKA
jgi:hypothetical protein